MAKAWQDDGFTPSSVGEIVHLVQWDTPNDAMCGKNVARAKWAKSGPVCMMCETMESIYDYLYGFLDDDDDC